MVLLMLVAPQQALALVYWYIGIYIEKVLKERVKAAMKIQFPLYHLVYIASRTIPKIRPGPSISTSAYVKRKLLFAPLLPLTYHRTSQTDLQHPKTTPNPPMAVPGCPSDPQNQRSNWMLLSVTTTARTQILELLYRLPRLYSMKLSQTLSTNIQRSYHLELSESLSRAY